MEKHHWISYTHIFQMFQHYSSINIMNSKVPYDFSAQVGQYWVNFFTKIAENENFEETDRFGFVFLCNKII
jgi:hypothetical protein